jgi:hypothetical protein
MNMEKVRVLPPKHTDKKYQPSDQNVLSLYYKQHIILRLYGRAS